MKRILSHMLPALLTALLLTVPAAAAEADVVWGDVYCFSPAALTGKADALGVMMTGVPDEALGKLRLGSRVIQPGDVLTAQQADRLTFVPVTGADGEAEVACMSITPDGLGEESRMTLKIGSGKNEAPVAEDSEFETYKNISGEISLRVSDPDGDALTVTIVKEPKRGTLEVGENGTVTYTPEENKVGKDSFTYTVTDTAGNTSEEATVRIQIKKPSDKATYQDMDGDPAQLAAVWLRESGIYSGKTVAGELLFCPEESVSRGEFIAMCVALTQQQPELLETGLIDGDDTPLWLQPYVSTALKCGYISGVPTENGLALLADQPIRQGEAAVMLSRLLELSESETVMADRDAAALPAWVSGAVQATAEAGLKDLSDVSAPLTRRDAALLLHEVWQVAEQQENSLLSWARE